MVDSMRRVLRLISVPVWLLLLASPAYGEPRASPLPGLWLSAGSAVSGPDLPATWWRGWRDHFALRLRGIEYRDEFVFHRQHLRLRISGPVVKGNPGLRVELRGWEWRGTTARFSAYGSAKRQGFRFAIEF